MWAILLRIPLHLDLHISNSNTQVLHIRDHQVYSSHSLYHSLSLSIFSLAHFFHNCFILIPNSCLFYVYYYHYMYFFVIIIIFIYFMLHLIWISKWSKKSHVKYIEEKKGFLWKLSFYSFNNLPACCFTDHYCMCTKS